MKKSAQWAGFVLLPIIIILLVVLLKWESISYYTLRKVADFYAGKEHIALDLGRIDGRPLSQTTIDNVSIRPGDGQPQAYNIKTRSISCSYNLWDLKDGIELFIQGLQCTARDPEFVYDLRIAIPEDPTSDKPPQFLVPAVFPMVDVLNGTLILTGSGWDAEAREINSSLRPVAANELLIETKNFRFTQDGSIRIETGFTSKLLYSDSILTIDSLELGEKEISAKGFIDLAKIDKGLKGFGADISFAESQLGITGAMENRLLQTHVKTENFDIGELQKRLGGTGWDISGKIRGEADLVYNLESKQDFNGSFNLDVRDGLLHGVGVDSFSLTGSFDNEILNISSAEAKTLGNHVYFNDVSVPVTLLQNGEAPSAIRGTTAKFGVSSKDFSTLLKLIKVDNSLLPEALKPDSFSITGSLDHEILNISSAEAITPDNRFLINDVSVPVPLLQDGDTLSILGGTKAEFEVSSKDFTTLLKFLKIDRNQLPEAIRPDSLTLKGYLKNGAMYLDQANAVTSHSSLVIDRAIIPIPATAEAFESVPIDLEARFESSSLEELAGLLGNLPINGQVVADLSVTGSIKESITTVGITGKNLSYKEMQLGSLALQGELRVSQEKPGTVKSAQLTVSEMTQINDFGSIALLSPATGTWQPENFSLDADFQLDEQGKADIAVKKTPGRETSAKIITSNIQSDGWLENFVDNRYFFDGGDIEVLFTELSGKQQVQLKGSVGTVGGTEIDFPMSGKFTLQYSSKGIAISEFTWKSHEKNQLTLTGFLPYDPLVSAPFLDGKLSLDGHIDFPALEGIGIFLDPLGINAGSLVLDVGISGSWKEPLGHLLLQADAMEPPDKLKEYSEAPVNIMCDLAAENGAILLKSASLESADYSAKANGTWKYGVSVKELLQKRMTELTGEVSADVVVDFKNMNFLKNKLAWLRRFDGNTQVKLKVNGPASDPDLLGSFIVQDGEMSHTFNFPTLSSVNLQGEFNRESLTISSMQGEVGGSPVQLSGKVNRGQKDNIEVSLQAEGKNVLLFRNNDMRMRGDVQLDISGSLERLVIKGTAGMTGGYYTRNIDFLGMIGSGSAPVSEGSSFLFSFTDPPLRDAVLDIKITTIEPFKVRNNLIRGVLRPELFLKGTGELPFLLGTIYIDSSRVLLPSGGLQIQSGLLRFLEGKPDRPQLNILAQSKVLGYDINVATRGPLDDPVITLSSSPALPSDDLMLLLLTGQPPKQDAAGGANSSGTTNVMVYLGRDFLNKWFEDESGTADETILDRFELDFGRSVTKSGEQTVDSTFRLSKETIGTGKIFYLTGEKDKYDAINYGLKLVFRLE